jgi:hypothetical protein
MKNSLLLFCVYIFCACQNSVQQKQSSGYSNAIRLEKYIDKQWAQNPLWNDGNAEVAQYKATRTIYKKERKFTYTYITVSEDFNKEFNVKTDDYQRKDLYKVMKVNAFAAIQTDNYPYHFLTSMFFLRGNSTLLHKFTNSSQEWCGNTFKEFLNEGENFKYNYHSYWDGEGDGSTTINSDLLFEDQLNYTLRTLKFKDGLTFKAKVLESQITSKAKFGNIYSAQFLISDDKKDLKNSNNWEVTVNLEKGKTNFYYFDKKYPNIMMKAITWDGRNLDLEKVSRYAYWKH